MKYYQWRNEKYAVNDQNMIVSAPNSGYGTLGTVGKLITESSLPVTESVRECEPFALEAIHPNLEKRMAYGMPIWQKSLDIKFDNDLLRIRNGKIVWSNNPRWPRNADFWPIYVQYDPWTTENPDFVYQNVDLMDRNITSPTLNKSSQTFVEPDEVPEIELAGIDSRHVSFLRHILPLNRPLSLVGTHGFPVETAGEQGFAWMLVGTDQIAKHILAYNHILREFPTEVIPPKYTIGMHGNAYQDEATGHPIYTPRKSVHGRIIWHLEQHDLDLVNKDGALSKHLLLDHILQMKAFKNNEFALRDDGLHIPARGMLLQDKSMPFLYGLIAQMPIHNNASAYVQSLNSDRIAQILEHHNLPHLVQPIKERIDFYKQQDLSRLNTHAELLRLDKALNKSFKSPAKNVPAPKLTQRLTQNLNTFDTKSDEDWHKLLQEEVEWNNESSFIFNNAEYDKKNIKDVYNQYVVPHPDFSERNHEPFQLKYLIIGEVPKHTSMNNVFRVRLPSGKAYIKTHSPDAAENEFENLSDMHLEMHAQRLARSMKLDDQLPRTSLFLTQDGKHPILVTDEINFSPGDGDGVGRLGEHGENDIERAFAFDVLIANHDRHAGNCCLNTHNRFALIDHGNAFSFVPYQCFVPHEYQRAVSPQLVNYVHSIQPHHIQEALRDLPQPVIDGALHRLEQLQRAVRMSPPLRLDDIMRKILV